MLELVFDLFGDQHGPNMVPTCLNMSQQLPTGQVLLPLYACELLLQPAPTRRSRRRQLLAKGTERAGRRRAGWCKGGCRTDEVDWHCRDLQG